MDAGSYADWGMVIANFLLAGAAIFAAFSWRREAVGRRKIELAEKFLSSTYEATDKLFVMLSDIKNYINFINEQKSIRVSEEDGMANNALAKLQLISSIDKESEFFSRFKSNSFQARATFSYDGDFIFGDVVAAFNDIRAFIINNPEGDDLQGLSVERVNEMLAGIRMIVYRAERTFGEYVHKGIS